MKKLINPISGSIFLVIILSLITFSPLNNETGFSLNDWHPTLSKLTNTSFFNLFKFDRPVLALIYPITTKIFYLNPFLWQLFGIFLNNIRRNRFFYNTYTDMAERMETISTYVSADGSIPGVFSTTNCFYFFKSFYWYFTLFQA